MQAVFVEADLDIQVLPRSEVHDVDIEVIVSCLGQQFPQSESFWSDIQSGLLAGGPNAHLWMAVLSR